MFITKSKVCLHVASSNREMKVELHSLLTQALDGRECLVFKLPADLPTGKLILPIE